MRKLLLSLTSLAALSGLATAQAELAGFDQFPQFRGVSGLSGGGFAVGPDGQPSRFGALSLSTPIGYTLGHRRLYFSASVISPNSGFIGFRNSSGLNEGNGGLFGVGGVNMPGEGRLSASFHLLSSQGDNVQSVQFQPPHQEGPVRFSLGLQDVWGTGGSSGQGVVGDDRSSRSAFVAATAEVGKRTFVSAGWGTRRFGRGFFNASANLTDDLKAMLEHDGFNWNYGVAYTRPLSQEDEGQVLTMFLGYVRGKYLTWSLGVSF